jgi:hypothetical protein
MALKCIEQACAIQPSDPLYQKKRVELLESLGRFNESKYLQ